MLLVGRQEGHGGKKLSGGVLVLPFWYRLNRVVLEKGPLNGCVCVNKIVLPEACLHGCCEYR